MSSYSGWTNYETWLVKVWLDNDQGSYDYWRDRSIELWEECDDLNRKDRLFEISRNLEIELKDQNSEILCPSLSSGIYADLLNASLQVVNWQEIAESLADESTDGLELKVTEGLA